MKNWKAIGSSRFAVVGALLLVGALWGSSFPLVAVAAPTLGAVGTTHGRFIVAALVLALITASSRSTWRAVGHRFPAFLLLAALNVAGPLTLVATAIVGLNSSTASILNATTPMFTVFVAAFWLRQKITWRKTLGGRDRHRRRLGASRWNSFSDRQSRNAGHWRIFDRGAAVRSRRCLRTKVVPGHSTDDTGPRTTTCRGCPIGSRVRRRSPTGAHNRRSTHRRGSPGAGGYRRWLPGLLLDNSSGGSSRGIGRHSSRSDFGISHRSAVVERACYLRARWRSCHHSCRSGLAPGSSADARSIAQGCPGAGG